METGKRHALRAPIPEAATDWLNPLSLGTMSASAYVENIAYNSARLINYQDITRSINLSCLKWCSLINCNWCVSMDIA